MGDITRACADCSDERQGFLDTVREYADMHERNLGARKVGSPFRTPMPCICLVCAY